MSQTLQQSVNLYNTFIYLFKRPYTVNKLCHVSNKYYYLTSFNVFLFLFEWLRSMYHLHAATYTVTWQHELRSFCPMFCSPGVVLPGPRVILPGVWSCFIRTESAHLYLCLWAPFLERGVFTQLFHLRWNDFILRVNRLQVRAKRFQVNRTSGKMTCFQ